MVAPVLPPVLPPAGSGAGGRGSSQTIVSSNNQIDDQRQQQQHHLQQANNSTDFRGTRPSRGAVVDARSGDRDHRQRTAHSMAAHGLSVPNPVRMSSSSGIEYASRSRVPPGAEYPSTSRDGPAFSECDHPETDGGSNHHRSSIRDDGCSSSGAGRNSRNDAENSRLGRRTRSTNSSATPSSTTTATTSAPGLPQQRSVGPVQTVVVQEPQAGRETVVRPLALSNINQHQQRQQQQQNEAVAAGRNTDGQTGGGRVADVTNNNGRPATSQDRYRGALAGAGGRPPPGWGSASAGAGTGAGFEADGGGGEVIETWRLGLRVGSELDVMDTVEKWCEATVLAVDREADKALISYTYWAPKWNEWIDIDSPCLAPPGTKTYQEGGPLRTGQRVEVLDEEGMWLEADVMEERSDGQARVHFKNFHRKFDKWVSPLGGEVRQFGPYRASASKGNRTARKASLAPGQQHVRQIAQLSRRYEHYCRALESQGLHVTLVEGDGNCLFRSVSHQVYGDDRYHTLVRARCMDYMESEAHFFEPYVEGDMAAFLIYVNEKRRNAVWGDDPEVQALCEIYDRPAEIWAYDPQLGAKTLRTFHEAGGSSSEEPRRPPMRLSYYGGGHYDSVSRIRVPVTAGSTGTSTTATEAPTVLTQGEERRLSPGVTGGGLPRGSADVSGAAAAGAAEGIGVEPSPPEPGTLEEEALQRSRRRAAEAGNDRWEVAEMKQRRGDETFSDGSMMDHALAWSRNVFEAQFDDLDSALVASVDHMEKSNLSSLEAASRDSELVVLQEEMLRTAQAQSEEEQLRHALEASCSTAAAAAAEADMVRQAIAESMGAAPSGTTSDYSADAVKGAGDRCREAEGEQGKGGIAGGARDAAGDSGTTILAQGVAEGAVKDEDEELKRVLALSGIESAGRGGEWQTMTSPGSGGGGGGGSGGGVERGQNFADFDDLDLEQDPELRQAIEASLAGQ